LGTSPNRHIVKKCIDQTLEKYTASARPVQAEPAKLSFRVIPSGYLQKQTKAGRNLNEVNAN
jgi:hypothetical protein